MKLLQKRRLRVHLEGIVNKVPQEKDIEVGLLIGVNCARALEPQEVISCKNGGPFAFSSHSAWCVIGPSTKTKKKGAISCNRIVVQDAVLGNCAFHHFGVSSHIKDVSARQMLMTVNNTEFCERKGLESTGIGTTHIEEFSDENRRFLQMMDKNSRKFGTDYELPLLLKDTEVTFPSNRFLVEKRLQHLKRRFMKNPDFFNDYKELLEELICKGYARMSNKEAPFGRTW